MNLPKRISVLVSGEAEISLALLIKLQLLVQWHLQLSYESWEVMPRYLENNWERLLLNTTNPICQDNLAWGESLCVMQACVWCKYSVCMFQAVLIWFGMWNDRKWRFTSKTSKYIRNEPGIDKELLSFVYWWRLYDDLQMIGVHPTLHKGWSSIKQESKISQQVSCSWAR